MLHHGRRDINGVGRNGHAFPPSEFHLKVHYHLSFSDRKNHNTFMGAGKDKQKKVNLKKRTTVLYHLSA